MTDDNNTGLGAPAEGTEEPSIEEILASIRKIISDEPAAEEAEVAAEVVDVTESPALADEADEILDLTPFAAPPPEVSVVEEPEPVELALDEIAPEPEPYIPPPQPAMMEDGLLSASAASAVTHAMQKLKQPEHNPLMQNTVLVGVKTLEQVVEELLRPLLAQWCDEHLPKMVERAVERELARLARRLEDQ